MKTIEYKGNTITTKHYCELSNEDYIKLKNDFYSKPSIESVKNEMLSISRGGVRITNITNYYVKDLMAKTILWHCKWSLEDVFECKELLSRFVAQTYTNDKVFPPNKPLIKNVETALRIGGKGVAEKPANFPLQAVDYIVQKYNINNWWYDYSCGWGTRLIGALKNNINYFGTDPNYILCERLVEISEVYKSTISESSNIIDIQSTGSEIFHKKYKGKIGLAFSSPPYYNLEDYRIGKQSFKDGVTYNDWLKNFIVPTVDNIYEYLVDNGYFLINIKNYKSYNLVEDIKEIITKKDFSYCGIEVLINNKRCNMFGELNDNSEGILVFQKSNKKEDLNVD